MSVMAVLMGAALPVWNKQAQREREEEYLFRATEYARAIQKFQRRAGPGTLAAHLRRARRRALPAPQIQGPDDRGRFSTCLSDGGPGRTAGRQRHAGWAGRSRAQCATGRHVDVATGRHTHRRHGRAGARRRRDWRRLEEQGHQHQDLQRPHPLRPMGGHLPGRESREGLAARPAAGHQRHRGRRRAGRLGRLAPIPSVRRGDSPVRRRLASPGCHGPGNRARRRSANLRAAPRPSASHAGPPAANPFGQPGAPPGGSPFGTPGGASGTSPAYPPLPGATTAPPIFGAPPRKSPLADDRVGVRRATSCTATRKALMPSAAPSPSLRGCTRLVSSTT